MHHACGVGAATNDWVCQPAAAIIIAPVVLDAMIQHNKQQGGVYTLDLPTWMKVVCVWFLE